MTKSTPEVALTPEEVQEILAHCGPHALLVSGQALALWAAVYDVTPPPVLAGAISSDADFIGNVQLARKLGHALKLWDFWQPAPDDATTQTAKLTRTVANGIKQIDFLDGIAGLDTQAVQRRAATITLASRRRAARAAPAGRAGEPPAEPSAKLRESAMPGVSPRPTCP
ncbi:MAG: hypothetical protein JWO52_3527 [Gammaproteobacteria bacterium]|nr:hypothetical protein [Gammaproteobacteria bacterium]